MAFAGDTDKNVPLLVEWFRKAATSGGVAPSNEAIAERFGYASTSSACRLVLIAEARGLIIAQRIRGQPRIVSAPDGSWSTQAKVNPGRQPRVWAKKPSRAKPRVFDPNAGGVSNPNLTPAQQANVDAQKRKHTAALFTAHSRRCRALPPLAEGEAERLVAEALAQGRVTRCPTMAVAKVGNGTGFA